MKKIAIILGALVLVAVSAEAKEILAAADTSPIEEVVVEEVMHLEEVYVQDEISVQEMFKPNAKIGLEYRAYCKTEGHGDKYEIGKSSQDKWNRGRNRYSKLESTFDIEATEALKIEGRIRDYANLERDDNRTRINSIDGSETRLRGYYKHSDLLTSRVEYEHISSSEEKYEYQLRITPYKNEGSLLNRFTIAPKYAYTKDNNGTDYKHTLGTDIYLDGDLPLGFRWESNLYLNYDKHNDDRLVTGIGRDNTDKEFVATWEMYLYKNINLYAFDYYTLDFNFEGGYDPYVLRNRDGLTLSEGATYSLYTAMDIGAKYSLSDSVEIKSGVGAEYRNWDRTAQTTAKDWRWQPFVYAALNIKL